VGGFLAAQLSHWFANRSSVLVMSVLVQTATLVVVGTTSSFWIALTALVVASITMAAVTPIRQTLLNSLISSEQRATVLSFDGLMGSTGGVVIQPALGRASDVWSYGTAYVVGGVIQLMSAPFLIALRTLGLEEDSVGSADSAETGEDRQ
jgi:MFS family permease